MSAQFQAGQPDQAQPGHISPGLAHADLAGGNRAHRRARHLGVDVGVGYLPAGGGKASLKTVEGETLSATLTGGKLTLGPGESITLSSTPGCVEPSVAPLTVHTMVPGASSVPSSRKSWRLRNARYANPGTSANAVSSAPNSA